MHKNVKAAIEDFREGRFVVLVDDQSRENEGDLAIAAEKATPQAVNFMITYGKGLVCVPLTAKRLDELHIPLMSRKNTEITKCQFAVSVDHKLASTGISAFDRALTVQKLLDPSSKPGDFRMPGHMFPLRYAEGGVLKRKGHTEASIDLSKLAGLYPSSVICEIINADGTMARGIDLEEFSSHHGIRILQIEELVEYIRLNSP